MAYKRITQTETVQEVDEQTGYILVTQDEQEGGQTVHSLRRAPAASVLVDVDDLGLEQDEETGYVYPTYKGVRSENGIPLVAGGGGGGGGGGNNAVLTVTNTTGWLARTISTSSKCLLQLTWSSLEDGLATGDGTMTVTVNGALKKTANVAQGAVSVEVSGFLTAGTNKVKVKIADVYDNSKTITYTVTMVELRLESNFDTSGTFAAGADIEYTYTPIGSVEKTVYFIVDGTTDGTETVTVSGRQLGYTIEGLSHGAHTLLVYFEATIDGETVRSNELYYSLIVVDPESSVPIIGTTFRGSTVEQYNTLAIPYRVYTPNSLQSSITLKVNGTAVSTLTVDRTEQTWSYRPDDTGALTLAIVCGATILQISLTVTESDIDAHAETQDLALYLTSYGRSNSEANPGTWVDTDNNISATMTGFNFVSDGWIADSQGVTALRVAGAARVTIPYQPFAQDFRGTGKTIEIEFATRNILNYDTAVISCMSGGRGFQLTAQKARLASEQSEISTQYKEDEHVRISFVAEKRTENRLLYIYINGIMSGVVQYPADDDFSQVSPVGISIGSGDAATDVYCIRVYDNDLTRYQILDNWIADAQSITTMLERYGHNDIFDAYGKVVIEKLPSDLPYLVLTAAELPQYKGDKKTISGYYVDPTNASKSFSFTGAQIDVQGTSSQYYPRKNYKIKFNGGFTMTATGQTVPTFGMRSDSIPTKTFTMKADVASSEGANNVELVRLYNDACPYQTPPQEADSRVRQGIDGFPIVIFWDNGTDVAFVGKYNFNNDKGTEEVFGFQVEDESWEILNNTSDRVLWKSADFSGTDWLNDFEGRYPDGNEDGTNLAALAAWLVTTDQSAATGDTLETPYTDVDGNTHTVDNAAYRLAKFKTEAADHLELSSAYFYYLFTELFLMVDSRAKNAFPSMLGGDKWCWLPYDFDTAIGINNEGALAFDYSLEDTDTTSSGADVFNGQQSVMWINLRDAFRPQIQSMYQNLRSTGALSYSLVESAFENHQAKWPEALFNEDSWYKYIDPLIEDGTASYLSMAQGSKAEQRKWWLYNRFRYIDSKYNAGDALTDVIQLRGYAKANITITPYADIYPAVKFGSYLVSQRGARNTAATLVCPLDNVNDTEIYIYSASQLASVGDLSGLKVGFADFSMATRLQSIKVGDSDAGYTNGNLTELYVGNNALLSSVDARNCTALTGAIDLSGAANIEDVYFDGTAITSCAVPNGGVLKTLRLPGTITNLTVRNQGGITTFNMPSYANVTTLRIENSANTIPVLNILAAMAANSRVRIIGFTMTVSSTSEAEAFYDKLDTMRGLDENGNNLDHAVAAGTITGLDTVTGAWLASMQARYPDITITYNHISCDLKYYNYDGSELLHVETVTDGGDGAWTGAPTRPATAANTYTFAGWSRYTNQTTADATATKAVTADRNVYAAYTVTGRTYTVTFYNGSTLLQTVQNVPYGGTATYTGTTPVDPSGEGKDFDGWNPSNTNIQGNTTCYAQFASAEPEHTITDTWAEIFQHIALGDYATRYSVGDTMSLNLGAEGYINMQIAAFDTDVLASDSTRRAPITWISEQLLNTYKRMNPELVTNYKFEQEDSFKRSSSSTSNTGYNRWDSKNAYMANNTAKITLTVTAVENGTLRLIYFTGASASNTTSLKVDGTEVISSHSTTAQNYDLAITSGTTYVIVFETTKLNNTDASAPYIKLCNTSGSGKKADVDALVTQDSVVIENCAVREIDDYDSGTGAIGGWTNCELRSYLRDTVKALIPSEVRSHILEVTKQQPSYNTAGTQETQTTTDDVWIPSSAEVSGSTGAYYGLFRNTNANRIKYKSGAASAYNWWLRSGSSTSYFSFVTNFGGVSYYSAHGSSGVALGFCT